MVFIVCARATVPIANCKIASCTASSEHDDWKHGPCEHAYDGDMGTDWATNAGAAMGSWIKLQFSGAQAIAAMNFANRDYSMEQTKGLRLEFSDGSRCSTAAFLLGPGRIALRTVW